MEQHGRSFHEDIQIFLNACPGPAVAKRGLHLAAFQEVRGIRGLERAADDDKRQRGPVRRRSAGQSEGGGSYLRKLTEIAELLGCRPAYLTETALRHGYQYSKALRWIRFFHGTALRATGLDAQAFAMRLGFSDLAGWSRFTKRLLGKTAGSTGMIPTVRHRGGYSACLASVVLVAACTPSDGIPDSQTSKVTVRDSAGIEVVENHLPEWDAADFWTVDPEPQFILGAEGDSSHLVWGVRIAKMLSDGRVATLDPNWDTKVLVFDRTGELSTSFARQGRGPGEHNFPQALEVLSGDTIVIWESSFGPVNYFDPSGRLLRERHIDLGAVISATRTDDQHSPESMYRPLPDGSFLVQVHRTDWRPPTTAGVVYRKPLGYVRIDSAYAAYSMGWWEGAQEFVPTDPGVVPFPPFPITATANGGGSPLSVYITNGDRYEVHQFSATGILLRVLRRTIEPRPVSDYEMELWSRQNAINAQFGFDMAATERAHSALPRRYHAAIHSLQVDQEGYLWVNHFLDGEANSSEWSVFDAEGRWLGNLSVPALLVHSIGNDFILGAHVNYTTGVRTIAYYRLHRRTGHTG